MRIENWGVMRITLGVTVSVVLYGTQVHRDQTWRCHTFGLCYPPPAVRWEQDQGPGVIGHVHTHRSVSFNTIRKGDSTLSDNRNKQNTNEAVNRSNKLSLNSGSLRTHPRGIQNTGTRAGTRHTIRQGGT